VRWLSLIDLSVVMDSVDHSTLLHQLSFVFRLQGTSVLQWICSSCPSDGECT